MANIIKSFKHLFNLNSAAPSSKPKSKVEKTQEVITREPFGVLTVESGGYEFLGKLQWAGENADLTLSADEPNAIEKLEQPFTVLVSSSTSINAAIRHFIEEDVRGGVLKAWVQVEIEEFMKSLKLEAVSLHEDGEYSFSYWGGDLLGGHWAVVQGSVAEGPYQLGIEG